MNWDGWSYAIVPTIGGLIILGLGIDGLIQDG